MTTLTDYVKNSTGLADSTITAVTNSTIAFITNSLRNNESVKIEGLGVFSFADKPEREGRNPRTGEPTMFRASRRIKLNFSKSFLELVQPDSLSQVDEDDLSLTETFEHLPEMPPVLSADLLPQSTYFLPPELTTITPPPIPTELLPEPFSAQPKSVWQIKAPDGTFIEVLSADLTNWGVTANTPVYSLTTGWLLAGKVPELAEIVV